MEVQILFTAVGNISKATKIYYDSFGEVFNDYALQQHQEQRVQDLAAIQICFSTAAFVVSKQNYSLKSPFVNVTNIIKMTTKWFSKGKFYNKTLNKDKYHMNHPICFLFCDSKIEFPPLYYLNKRLEKLSIFFNALFL